MCDICLSLSLLSLFVNRTHYRTHIHTHKVVTHTHTGMLGSVGQSVHVACVCVCARARVCPRAPPARRARTQSAAGARGVRLLRCLLFPRSIVLQTCVCTRMCECAQCVCIQAYGREEQGQIHIRTCVHTLHRTLTRVISLPATAGASMCAGSACAAGKYGSLGSASAADATCTPCSTAAGNYCPPGSTSSEGVPCLASTYSSAGASRCLCCTAPPFPALVSMCVHARIHVPEGGIGLVLHAVRACVLPRRR